MNLVWFRYIFYTMAAGSVALTAHFNPRPKSLVIGGLTYTVQKEKNRGGELLC